jgi:hypothetical protein
LLLFAGNRRRKTKIDELCGMKPEDRSLVVLVVGLAGALGYVMGDSSDGAEGTDRSGADCPLVHVPVSDHVEALCVPSARPLVEFFDEDGVPPGATAEGRNLLGELWLVDADGTETGGEAFCWAETPDTNRVRCSEPVGHGSYVGEVEH